MRGGKGGTALMLHRSAVSDPEIAGLFSGPSWVRAMLAFEAALAEAEGKAGLIPGEAAAAIAATCRRVRLDAEAIAQAARHAGNLAIPLVA